MPHSTVAIVGVGLIGGSIGLALRERKLAKTVIGIGRREETLREAQKIGAIDKATTNIADGVRDADLIIVCTPVDLIVEQVREISQYCPAKALITDCGSTKREIVTALQKPLKYGKFVGSHPLAGSEKTGPSSARADLYNGRIVVVTPGKGESTERGPVREIAEFWSSLGATAVFMSAADHDRALASTSHLPHIVAATLARNTSPEDLLLTATGWRDTTRIAAGDPELWTQITLSNRQNILKTLRQYGKSLAGFMEALEKEDARRLRRFFTEAKEVRDALEG